MLSFDYALNQYEISGVELDKERVSYLDSIMTLLKRYAVVFPGLYLRNKEIRATHGGKVYTLGKVYTQGDGEGRIIYPCFRDQWDFDFAREIVSFFLWKDMSETLRESYTELESTLLTAQGEEARALISLALLKDFIAMAGVEGEHYLQKRQELSFLKGLISLYYLGIVQKKIRTFLGVNLQEHPFRPGARVRRAPGESLNLLIGEDIANAKLYQVVMSYGELYPLTFIKLYFSYRSRGVLKNADDLIKFSISFSKKFRETPVRGWRINAVKFPHIVDLLGAHPEMPVDSEAAQRYLENLDKEFVRFRKENLDRIIVRDQRLGIYTLSSYHKLQSQEIDTLLGRGRSHPIDVLSIDYISPSGAGAPFDGTVNIVGHADLFGLAGVSNPGRIANWMYANFSAAFGKQSLRFKEIKCINFAACNFPEAMAGYISVLFLERCLEEGNFDVTGDGGVERRRIPRVTVVCSPRVSLISGSAMLIPFDAVGDDRMSPLPGIVLNVMNEIRSQEFIHFVSKGGSLDFNQPFVQRFLQETNIFSVAGLVGSAFQGGAVSEAEFERAKQERADNYRVYEEALKAEKARRRAEKNVVLALPVSSFGPLAAERHIALVEHLAYEMVSIKPEGEKAFLRVNTFETMRVLHDYYAAVKNRYRSRTPSGTIETDAEINSQLYKGALDELKKENRIKFIIDPLDPQYHYKRQVILKGFREHLGIVYREFRDFSYYSPHDFMTLGVQPDNYQFTSYYSQQLADILFVVSKQEYREITGIEVDKIPQAPGRGVSDDIFRKVQSPTHSFYGRVLLGTPLYHGLSGSEQLGVSTRDLRTVLESGEDSRILPAIDQLENSLNRKKALLNDSRSLKSLQETQENLGRAKTSLQKKQLSPTVLKTTARMATGSSRLLGAFGVFADFRTQPFHLDFSSVKSGLFTSSDSLAVVKGVFDFSSDVGTALALRLASSAGRALWQPRLDRLFFKMNKVLLPLDVLFTAVSLYRNVEGARLAKTVEEQALYITMTVIDGVAFGVSLAGFILIGVPGVGVALILVGMALAVVNIILNAIVSLAQLENYRWQEKVGLFFANLFGSLALQGILAQKELREAADRLFDGNHDHTRGGISSGLSEEGIDLLLTPMINDDDDNDQTNALKDIGERFRDSGARMAFRGHTLSPLGVTPNDLQVWGDAKDKGKRWQVHKGWYLRRREGRLGQERKLMVTMPCTPSGPLEVLDFGPIPTILLFGGMPHMQLKSDRFDWVTGQSPQEQMLKKYQVRLHAGIAYTLQFKRRAMTSEDLDSNFGGRTELVVPEGEFQTLPPVSLDLSGQEDARETIPELDLSRSLLEVIKFKGKSAFKLDLVSADSHAPCALERVVRTVQLPAYIRFKSGSTHPVMAVVGEASRITLRNSTGRSLLLLRREVTRCEVDIQASVGGFAIAV